MKNKNLGCLKNFVYLCNVFLNTWLIETTKRYARLADGNVRNFQWTARTVYRFARIAWAGYSFSVQGNSHSLRQKKWQISATLLRTINCPKSVLVGRRLLGMAMAEIKFPVTALENERFQVVVDMSLYAKESLVATCYKFTDRFYIHQQTDGGNVDVVFESKDGNAVSDSIVKQFCNELIDHQVRFNTNQQFGHIRDLIVEEAFKPVSKWRK